MAQRVGRGIALLFHDRGTRRRWVVSSMPWPHFTPGKDPVPILQEAGWAPGLVCTGGKSCPYRDLIPDRPAHSQSLYRLSYPARVLKEYSRNKRLWHVFSVGNAMVPHLIANRFLYLLNSRLRWFRGSVLAFSTQVCGFKPGRSCQIFRVKKSSACLPSEGK